MPNKVVLNARGSKVLIAAMRSAPMGEARMKASTICARAEKGVDPPSTIAFKPSSPKPTNVVPEGKERAILTPPVPCFELTYVRVPLIRLDLTITIAIVRITVGIQLRAVVRQWVQRPLVAIQIPFGEPVLETVRHVVHVRVLIPRVTDGE